MGYVGSVPINMRLAGFEPAHMAPEAIALSITLQARHSLLLIQNLQVNKSKAYPL
jgi:hypothetical protein